MLRRREFEDDWDDDFASEDDTSEEFDEGYSDAAEDEPTVPCPYCRQEIHEDAQRCPHCERYISDEDAPTAAKPGWIVIGGGACQYLVSSWTLG